MRRLIKLLAVTTLMVVLMASTAVSPAFASQGGDPPGRGYGSDKDKDEPYTAHTKLWGWACGTEKFDKAYYCDAHDKQA